MKFIDEATSYGRALWHLGYVAGSLRNLARGWANDEHFDGVHVFPCAGWRHDCD